MKIKNLIPSALISSLLFAISATQASVNVGDLAPDWTMQATDGQTYQLSELRGKHVVLAFFPKAFTGGCTIECKSVRDSKKQVRRFDVQFFMASTDDLETNKAFADQNNANFPFSRIAAKASVSPMACWHPWDSQSVGPSTLMRKARFPKSTKT